MRCTRSRGDENTADKDDTKAEADEPIQTTTAATFTCPQQPQAVVTAAVVIVLQDIETLPSGHYRGGRTLTQEKDGPKREGKETAGEKKCGRKEKKAKNNQT